MDISRRSFISASIAAAGAAFAGAAMTACGGGAASSAASSASASASADASASAAASSAAASGAATKKSVKIGIRADMVNQFAAVEDELKEAGYDVESVVFDDSVQPDVALGEGSIDCNWYQHEPYMQSYNESNGTDFVMVQPKTFYPLFAMYSSKHTDIKDIPDGATFGLCNDATNQNRGLHLLESIGFIKLPADKDVVSIVDVQDNKDLNPRGFKFIEAEMSVLPQSEADVDAIALAAGHMVNAGLPADNYIAQSDDNETYAVGFAVRKEDADAEWIKDIAKLVQCDDLAEYFKTEKQGTQIPLWK